MSTNASTGNAALYLQFIAALKADLRAQGLPEPTAAETPSGLPENEGFVFVEWGPHGQAPALIVPKSKTRMGALHSHVDLSGLDGHLPLPKKNGRVVCHFEPDVTKVSRALARFVGASKAPVRTPVRAFQATAQATSGRLPTLPVGPSEYDSAPASGPDIARLPAGPSEYDARDAAVDEALAALEA